MPRAATATLSALVALAALASASAPPADPAPGPAWHWPLGASYAVRDFDLGPPPVPERAWDAAQPSGFLGVPPEALERTGLTRVLVFGQGDLPDFGAGQHAAHRHAVSSNGFFSIVMADEAQIQALQARGYLVIRDFMLEFDGRGRGGVHPDEEGGGGGEGGEEGGGEGGEEGGGEGGEEGGGPPEISRIGMITNTEAARSAYGYSGEGVTVAIVDTGVDFSNPDIRGSLARDGNGHPVMLDADGQGIVLTNATFYASVDRNNIIRNHTAPLPENMTSSVYRTEDGVFLDLERGGEGTDIPIYNSFFPVAGSDPVFNGTLVDDMRIGASHRDYIPSKSGVYRLGVIYQGALEGGLTRIQVVPVLLTDPNTAGVYDTITPDLSTSWEDYTRFDLESGQEPDHDFDFTDEKPIVLGSGNEFLVYDSNGDGLDDYSAGTVGARVLDVYNVTSSNRTAAVEDHVRAVNGTLLPPIDPDGHYFGVMTDFYGHGTSSAASVASKGIQEYDIYNDTGKYSIVGAAPGASILPVKSLWFGDTVYAWLWTAGFDNDDTRWEFTGRPRADIVSNSWGVSNFPTLGAAPGMDILSLVLGALAVPHSLDDDFPGVTMVTSAGNSGPGYGTMGMPNSAPFGISVGATTNNVFVGYGPFRDQPRFGNSTEHHGHVVDFSSRGPGMIGDPKPDLMSSGAHSFVPSNVLKLEKDSDAESFSLFGGTSMATPLVAGSAAVLMQSMRENMMEYDPFVVKNILMSTASDLQNDALTQGSGMVDAKRAVDFVHGEGGVFAVHNDASYRNIRGVLSGPMGEVNSTMLNLDRIGLSGKAHPMTGWFGGHLPPGGRSTATFTVENPTAAEVEVAVSPQRPELVRSTSYDGVTRPLERDRALNDTAAYVPNYIQLSDVRAFPSLRSYYGDYGDGPGRGGGAGGEGGGAGALEGSDLLVLTLNFPFGEFMNKTNDTYGEDLRISSLYLYDWVDGDNDTRVASDELSMVSRGGSWGTVQELRVSEPASRFEGIPLVGVYPVPTKFSFWTGDLQANSTAMNYTLSSSYYRQQEWDPVWVDRGPVTVPPGGSAEVTATIVVPEGYETGVYNGFLRFSGGNHTANVPVSFAVTRVVEGESDIMIRGEESDSVLHAPGFVKGAFDMTSRYMAGDWRQYYFDVRDPSLNTAAIELSWENEDTNLAVFAVDPAGRIVQTNVPSGVFGQFMGWPSLDWLGVSPFSEGGGFFPAKNKDGTSTVLYVPMNQTGTYGLLVHSTLFAGESATEPITLSAKFTSVLGPERPPRIKMHVPGTVGDDTVVIPRVYDYNLDKVVFFANSTRILQGEGGALDFGALADGFYILTVTAFDTEGNYSTEQFEFVRRGAPEQRDGDDGGSGGGDGGGN